MGDQLVVADSRPATQGRQRLDLGGHDPSIPRHAGLIQQPVTKLQRPILANSSDLATCFGSQWPKTSWFIGAKLLVVLDERGTKMSFLRHPSNKRRSLAFLAVMSMVTASLGLGLACRCRCRRCVRRRADGGSGCSSGRAGGAGDLRVGRLGHRPARGPTAAGVGGRLRDRGVSGGAAVVDVSADSGPAGSSARSPLSGVDLDCSGRAPGRRAHRGHRQLPDVRPRRRPDHDRQQRTAGARSAVSSRPRHAGDGLECR